MCVWEGGTFMNELKLLEWIVEFWGEVNEGEE